MLDYQEVPYDDPDQEKFYKKFQAQKPHRGPQEGKYINSMLRGLKPATVLTRADEKSKFLPYIKNKTFILAGKDTRGANPRWVVTLPGEEWRAPKLLALFDNLTGENTPQENLIHAKIGLLLGIPKESIKWFIGQRK